MIHNSYDFGRWVGDESWTCNGQNIHYITIAECTSCGKKRPPAALTGERAQLAEFEKNNKEE